MVVTFFHANLGIIFLLTKKSCKKVTFFSKNNANCQIFSTKTLEKGEPKRGSIIEFATEVAPHLANG